MTSTEDDLGYSFCRVGEDDQDSLWPPLPVNCPPSGAIPASGTLYRVVSGSDADWQTSEQEYGHKAPHGASQCHWQAISLYERLEDAIKTKGLAKFKSNGKIAAVAMIEGMGVVEADGARASHHSWWPAAGFVPPPQHHIVGEATGG